MMNNPYEISKIFDSNAGKPIYVLTGPGMPYEPLLSGNHIYFKEVDVQKARSFCHMFNKVYFLAQKHKIEEMEEIKEKLLEIFTKYEIL